MSWNLVPKVFGLVGQHLLYLHARNPMVLLVGDDLLRMLLFWSMFVPLGASYSVDAALQTEPEQVPKSVFSAGTFALLAQVVILYVVSALQKSGAEWRDGTAIYYALSADMFARPLGVWLLQFPRLLSLMTPATRWFEFWGPLFCFSLFELDLSGRWPWLPSSSFR